MLSSNIVLLVLKKELKDMFRDKKTLIVGILIPLIIFPIMFGVMGKVMNKSAKQVEESVKVAIRDEDNSSLGEFIKSEKNIKLIKSDDFDKDIKDGKIQVAIEIPKGFQDNIGKETMSTIKLTYDNVSQQSSMALSIVKSYVDAYSNGVVAKRLEQRNIDPMLLKPIEIKEVTSVKEESSISTFMLSLMLPLLLVLYSALGPIASATDLGAGEKERGTLEPLLTTQAGRMSILWGKLLAITVMGFLTVAASLMGLFLAMQQKDGMFKGVSTAGLNLGVSSLLLMGLVSVLTTMAFAALSLAISIYARSFKEAQTYMTPLTIIVMIPAYAAYMVDPKNIGGLYFHIPVTNVTCLIKELLVGVYNYNHIFITFGWIVLYILVSILFARFMFSRESVIFRT